MRNIPVIIIALIFAIPAFAQISVSENNRFIQTKDGKPFFWLGDTDWEMFHRLTREEIEELINIRSEQGFNVLQAVALAEFNGIREPNRYGDFPLNNEDPTQLLVTPGNNPTNPYEYDYWDHVDFTIQKAAEKDMYIGLLPTWGDKVTQDWGEGPVLFTTPQRAEAYGKTLASRYANQKNIIWILGGDRPGISKRDGKEVDHRPIWRAMAAGIESVLGKEAFITYHPSGGSSSSQYVHDEQWLDMNAFQSGHGSRTADAWNMIKRDLALTPLKPTLDMEPCYEDHPVNPWDGKWTRERGYFTAYDVRARIYRAIFAGGSGVTYGHHHIWQFMNEELYKPVNVGDTIIPWRKAIKAEAAQQMQHLKKLMLSRPYYTRIDGQHILLSAPGKDYTDLVYATIDSQGSYAMVYLPQNKPVTISLKNISGDVKNVWWYNPRNGEAAKAKNLNGKGKVTLRPPADGKDWVIIIDDAQKKFPAPGTL